MQFAVAPFVRQALRAGSRSGKTYALRALMVLFLLLWLTSIQAAFGMFGAPGLQFFRMIMSMTAFIICLSGPLYFASVLTDEKENMTLGLLRITALSPLWILMGKSTSQLVGAVMLLVAQVPLVVLAVTLGGVSMAQVTAAYFALAAHLVLMANVGLLCSAVCARSRRASFCAGVLVLAFFLAPSLGRRLLSTLASAGAVSRTGAVMVSLTGALDWLHDASVYARLGEVMTTGFAGSPVCFQVGSNLGLGALFFLLSWAAFERFSQEKTSAAPARGLLLRRRTSRLRRLLGAGRAWPAALVWKDYHFLAGGKTMAVGKFIVLGLALFAVRALMIASGEQVSREDLGDLIMWVMLILVAIELVLFHARTFGMERRWRTLSTLMILPHSTIRIAYGKLAGCLLGLVPEVIWFSVGLALDLDGFTDAVSDALGEPGFWYAAGEYVLLVELALYLPLVMRRGGFLAAIVIWLVGSYAVLPLVAMLITSGMDQEVFFTTVAFCTLVAAALLHWRALKRLEWAAATE